LSRKSPGAQHNNYRLGVRTAHAVQAGGQRRISRLRPADETDEARAEFVTANNRHADALSQRCFRMKAMSTESVADEAQLPLPRITSSPFLRTVIHNGIAYLSGQLPYRDGEVPLRGIVGDTVSTEQGKEAARLCALNALGALQHELGSLDRVQQILRVTGYVASAPSYGAQSAVMDAASAVLVEYLGQRGKHARTALGVAALPREAPVEIDIVAAVSAATPSEAGSGG
jgi:enamine deaminase RidA (YjgF/YER057c/UK114 family)